MNNHLNFLTSNLKLYLDYCTIWFVSYFLRETVNKMLRYNDRNVST